MGTEPGWRECPESERAFSMERKCERPTSGASAHSTAAPKTREASRRYASPDGVVTISMSAAETIGSDGEVNNHPPSRNADIKSDVTRATTSDSRYIRTLRHKITSNPSECVACARLPVSNVTRVEKRGAIFHRFFAVR